MAETVLVAVPGDGRARTNPIHPADVAALCVRLLDSRENGDLAAGGPEVLTRDEIVTLAFRAWGRAPRILHLPAPPLSRAASMIRPIHPRIGELLEFGVRVFANDCVAPRAGERRLGNYFESLAGAGSGG